MLRCLNVRHLPPKNLTSYLKKINISTTNVSPVFPCPPRSRLPHLFAVPTFVPSPLARSLRFRLHYRPCFTLINPFAPFTSACPLWCPLNPGQVAMFLKVTVVASHGTSVSVFILYLSNLKTCINEYFQFNSFFGKENLSFFP